MNDGDKVQFAFHDGTVRYGIIQCVCEAHICIIDSSGTGYLMIKDHVKVISEDVYSEHSPTCASSAELTS